MTAEAPSPAPVEEIERNAEALAARSIEILWADPFWDARFGARGAKFAREDGRHHVSWLCEALRAGSAGVLVTYACWLQGVLVTRGMCSFHLAENLRSLGRALDERGLDPDRRAAALLEEGCAGLVRTEGAAGAVDAAAPALAEALGRDEAGWHPRDLRIRLSYLADALALDRPDLFEASVRFARTLDASETVDRVLLALAERVPAGADLLRRAIDAR